MRAGPKLHGPRDELGQGQQSLDQAGVLGPHPRDVREEHVMAAEVALLQRDARLVLDRDGVRGVAAQEPVLAEDPQVAGLDVRLGRDLGDVVGIGEAAPDTLDVVLPGEVIEQGAKGASSAGASPAKSAASCSCSAVAIAARGSRLARTSRSSSSDSST